MVIDVHRTWGYRDPKTGFFTGMAGQLQRKDADIGGNLIRIFSTFFCLTTSSNILFE